MSDLAIYYADQINNKLITLQIFLNSNIANNNPTLVAEVKLLLHIDTITEEGE